MGSSETGQGAVDCSVGSIVWVRRRNGSWWPGKILGPDELSASHITSPRSGTPVKLLGREDASVDWYNLEKSKRVKAFRCGEFDECISRAEASQGMPPKKREKYARREDAILHALDLEKQLLEKKYGKFGYSSNGEPSESPDAVQKDLVISSVNLENGDAKPLDCKSLQVCSSDGLSIKEGDTAHQLEMGKAVEVHQMIGDDNNNGVLSGVRGLQESGLVAAPLEHNFRSSDASNGSLDPFANNPALVFPNVGSSTEVIADANSNSFSKRHDKHRPLVQVLQNSAKVSNTPPSVDTSVTVARGEQEDGVRHAKRSRYAHLTTESGISLNDKRGHPGLMEIPVTKLHSGSPADLYEENTSDSAEDTETDSSETETTESDTDEDMMTLSDGAASIGLEPKYPGRIGLYAEQESASSEELEELALTDDISYSYYDNPVAASEGVSKWQLKGKRNNRSLMKRSLDGTERKLYGGSIHGKKFRDKGNIGSDESDFAEKSLISTRMVGYGSRGFDGINHDINSWENMSMNDHSATKNYWEQSEECISPAYAGRGRMTGRSMLVDVDLKVQASYQRPHVPLISLTSKVNGHAIVGHPVQIECLENGSTETILASSDDFYPETSEYSAPLAPVWRTARRTANSRVPRSHPASAPESDQCAANIQVGVYQDGRVLLGKVNAGTFGNKASIMKNNIGNSQLDRRFTRKQPKKVSLSLNQKIRTLSSIASQPNQSRHLKRGGNGYQGGGLIKADSVPTAVACIPVKLVFSRLHEELVGRHQ